MIDTLLFDLDGTLIETDFTFVRQSMNSTLSDLGHQAAHDDQLRVLWFSGDRNSLLKSMFGLGPDVFWPTFRKYSDPSIRKHFMRPYSDVDILAYFLKRDYKIGIVTGASPQTLELELNMLGRDSFHAVVHTHESNGVQYKPHPEGIYRCLEMLGSIPKRTLYVGNADEDYYMSLNANVPFVLIDRKDHDILGIPARKIETLYELKDIVSG